MIEKFSSTVARSGKLRYGAEVTPTSNYRLRKLATGSYAVDSLEFGESCHPGIGPMVEAQTLYVQQVRLRERLSREPGEFVIWDVGLGAAANVLTTLRATHD